MDVTLLGSTQLPSCTVLSSSTNAGAAGGYYEYPLKVTRGVEHACPFSSPFRVIRSGSINI